VGKLCVFIIEEKLLGLRYWNVTLHYCFQSFTIRQWLSFVYFS